MRGRCGASRASIFEVADFLLVEFDLGEAVVLEDDDLHRKLVGDRGRQFRHQHREAAITDDGDRGSIRIGQFRGDGIRKTGRHRGEHADPGQPLTGLELQTAGGVVGIGAPQSTEITAFDSPGL